MVKSIDKIYKDKEFIDIISDIMNNPTVLEMNNFRQHYSTSCYDHCLRVAYYTYIWCKKFRLNYVSASRAAMLHDLFLYDWRYKDGRKGFHAYTHPYTALCNASRIFDLNDMEKDIILKHMWPVTVVPPKYMESYIVTFTDKFAALVEGLEEFEGSRFYNKAFRFVYVFFGVLMIKYFI